MIELFIYLAGVSDRISPLLWVIGLVCSIGGGLGYIIALTEESDKGEFISKRVLFASLIALFINSLIPSANTLYTMAAAHYGKEAVQSEIGVKVKRILDLKIDEMLAEAEKKK